MDENLVARLQVEASLEQRGRLEYLCLRQITTSLSTTVVHAYSIGNRRTPTNILDSGSEQECLGPGWKKIQTVGRLCVRLVIEEEGETERVMDLIEGDSSVKRIMEQCSA